MQRHTACAAVLLLGGCASPYVQLEHRDKIDDVRPAALAEAIADARAVEARYRDKVIELGEAERSLSNGLLGIGTAVVGMGVAKVHPSTITGTALLGGSVYTIGTFNTDKRRAQAYVAGMKALDCAVATVTPLVLDDRQIAQLKTDREAVSQSVGEVSGAIGEAERWSARARAGDDAARFEAALAAVTQGIAAAQAAVSKGDEAIDLATQRLDKPQRIAADLRSAVSSIDSAVLEEIRGTENAVQSVPAVLATLQANAELFSLASLAPSLVPAPAGAGTAGASSPGPKSGDQRVHTDKGQPEIRMVSPTAEWETVRDKLTEALGNLRNRTVGLTSRAERLKRAASPSNAQGVSDALKACKIDGVVKNISVSPSAVTFAAKTAATQNVLVDGGNGNFTAAFLQSPTPGLTAVIRPRTKGVVDIVATDQTVAGSTYQLLIEDTTQQSRQIVTVTVSPAAQATTAKADIAPQEQAAVLIKKAGSVQVNGKTVPLLSVASKGSTVQVEYEQVDTSITDDLVAKAVLAIDGVSTLIGSDPSAVVAAPKGAAPHSGSLKKSRLGATQDWGTMVGALTREQIGTIQKRLCMPAAEADGRWGGKTQAALRADRERRVKTTPAGPGLDEPLTAAEAKALLALSEADAAQRCKR